MTNLSRHLGRVVQCKLSWRLIFRWFRSYQVHFQSIFQLSKFCGSHSWVVIFSCCLYVLDNPSVMWTKETVWTKIKNQMAKEKLQLTIYWKESVIIPFCRSCCCCCCFFFKNQLKLNNVECTLVQFFHIERTDFFFKAGFVIKVR